MTPRRLAVAALAGIPILLLSGCFAAAASPQESSDLVLTEVPADQADPRSALGDPYEITDVVAWADATLPDGETAGIPFSMRQVYAIQAGGTDLSDVWLDDGLWDLSPSWSAAVACFSESGAELAYTLILDGAVTEGTIPCAPEDEADSAEVTRIRFTPASSSELYLAADEQTGVVRQLEPSFFG